MAVFKIFPKKTSTIYSHLPNKNTGLDEILEIGQYNNGVEDCESRSLLEFDLSNIQNIISQIPSGRTYTATLKLFMANSSHAPLDYTLVANSLETPWDMGNGKFKYKEPGQGVTWNSPDVNQSIQWNGGDYSGLNECSQSFSYRDDKDISMDITPLVITWLEDEDEYEGLILRTITQEVNTKYFSGNTHTIYPPYLELGWNDSIHYEPQNSTPQIVEYNGNEIIPITNTISVITTPNIRLVMPNLKEKYSQYSIHNIRLNARELYPARKFQKSSVYLNTQLLPKNSYWAIKDLDTEEIIVDFSPNTQISSDVNGNFFKVYMNGLQPERYYKFLIKYEFEGEEIILDENLNFKVVK